MGTKGPAGTGPGRPRAKAGSAFRSGGPGNGASGAAAEGAASADARLRSFIAKFDPAHQRLIRAVRAAMRKRLPTAFELVYDNYNFLVIGYSPTQRTSDAIFSIAAGAGGLNLFFLRGAALADPEKVLLGSGRQVRFVRLESAAAMERPEIEALFAAALARPGVPMPAAGPGRLLIRSVSAKQRPRRRAAG